MTPWDYQSKRVFSTDGVMATLPSGELSGQNQQAVLVPVCEYRTPEGYCKTPDKTLPFLPYCVEPCPRKPSRMGECISFHTIDRPAVAYAMQGFGDYKDSGVASGLKARDYKDATDLVVEGMDCRNGALNGDLCWTLQAKPNGGFSNNCIHPVIIKTPVKYIVRRLTPTECARLQGFPDDWGHPDYKETFSNDEYAFWMGVRNTHAAINGKQEKQYTREQMVKWYNGLHTDSAEYKMWGNGIALPPALYCMQGIAEVLSDEG